MGLLKFRGQLALVLAAFSIVLAILAAAIRPDVFFVGDPGVKLVAARNAVRFPTHPLEIPLPRIGPDTAPHVEPFFKVHGDHSHAVTSELFPLLSAPPLAALGIRGIYIIPGLGFIATLWACAWLGSVLDPQRNPALVAATAALGTPFLFYGLEFWEHAPALALAVGGSALMLDSARRRPGRDSATGAAFVSGLLSGGAVLLRPEAACFVIAVIVASRTLVQRPTWRSLAIGIAGTAVALLPLELYTLLHFGSAVPGHVGTNAALIGTRWGAERVELARDWLLPSAWNGAGPVRTSSFWGVAPAAILAVVSIARPSERRERPFLVLVALITIGLVLLAAPNAGGGQWGPRYLLLAYVPLTLLAADLIQQLPRRRVWTAGAFVVLLAAGVWVQRAAYRQLRGTKATYGRIADFVGRTTAPGTSVVTDVWWLDQLAASELEDRTVLVADSAKTGKDIVERLNGLGVPTVSVFRSHEESAEVDSWSAGTCYVEESREELPVRGLVAIRLRHNCAGR